MDTKHPTEAILHIFRDHQIGPGESLSAAYLTPLVNGRQGCFSNQELQIALSELAAAGLVEILEDGSHLKLTQQGAVWPMLGRQ